MGSRQDLQGALLQEFSIEAHVPPDHLLRSADRFVDPTGIRHHLAPVCSATGRPPVDPGLTVRMLPVDCTMGIRSERRPGKEVHLNLAYRWLCRLDSGSCDLLQAPARSFSRQHLLRQLYETVVARCIAEGLAGSQRLATDARILQTDANRRNATPAPAVQTDSIEGDPAPRVVREHLQTLEDAAFGAASPIEPKVTSQADPALQWTGDRGGPAFLARSAPCLTDTDTAVILDVEATRSIRRADA